MQPAPALRTTSAQRVAGFVARASFDDASPIGGLWQEFGKRAGELGASAPPWSVYHDYDSDHRGAYSVLVGLPVDGETEPPAGWQALDVPAGTYLVFPVPPGPMPDVIFGAWQAIWAHFDGDAPFERTYSYDHEIHGDAVEIYLAVQRRQ